MLCKVRSLGLQGISGYEVTAECDLAGGLPNFDIVGLPDTAVKEARERGRTVLVTDALPTSEPILRERGFRVVTSTTPYVYEPEA